MRHPELARAMAAHADCPLSAVVYDRYGAHCASCNVQWPRTDRSDGTVVGYLTPPATPAARRDRYRAWFE